MEYEVVYDLVSMPNPFFAVDYIILVAGAFFLQFMLRDILRKKRRKNPRLISLVGATILSLFVYFFVLAENPDYQELLDVYQNGEFEIVEGQVEGFVEGSWGGNAPYESFEVDGVSFEHSFSDHSAAYRRIKSGGGKIEDGVYVIIWHVDGDIIHLEVATN